MQVKLDQIIKIQKKKLSETKPNGFKGESWEDLYEVMASANQLHGQELWAAMSVKKEKTVEFIVRYVPEIAQLDTKKHRILFNDIDFNIDDIDNIKFQNEWLKIRAAHME